MQKLRMFGFVILLFLTAACEAFGGLWQPSNPVLAVAPQSDGVVLTLAAGKLRLRVCSDSIIRVTYYSTPEQPAHPDYVIIQDDWPAVKWNIETGHDSVGLATGRLHVAVTRQDGGIAFRDASGKTLLQEESRRLIPATVNGEHTFRAESYLAVYGSGEGLYGLGQHQAGVWNYRGESVDLSQENANIAVPLLISSNGYGLFWNNTSRTRFNNRFPQAVYVSSEVADTIDYYFLYGPELDKVIAGYRQLTGAAPMFGQWAYGFWQCKNRYGTQEEILGVARKYRDLHIPVDNIVQDWFWWNRKGEHVFNRNYPDPAGMVGELHRLNLHLMISVWPFVEPGSAEYAEYDQRGWFITRTLDAKPPFHAQGMALYDATNPDARRYYWGLMDKALFRIGLDAWWLDSDEPESEGQEESILLGRTLAAGSGDRYANIYPLMHTSGVYQGQRAASGQKRVFILSRSAFAGAQRNAVAAWSGDINSDFLSFRRQIPGGLNYALSGLPYWTTDIGGFTDGNPDDPAYRELFVRWFEYGAFCPIFRVHGTRRTNQNELWSYGPEAQQILVRYDRLRYRLMPYIYSLAWMTTHDGYTPMRPLVMDFRDDDRAQNTGDQFMFGPAILVNPVTEPGATTRHLYLPAARWHEFWGGGVVEGGKALDAPAPLPIIPLYVRAGSIIPLGPDMEYAAEKPADPIELRVYTGADADFILYEDENDNYNYEKGVYSLIPLHWDEGSRTLTVGKREGKFPGMIERRTFNVIWVKEGHGAGLEPSRVADQVVRYDGTPVSVRP